MRIFVVSATNGTYTISFGRNNQWERVALDMMYNCIQARWLSGWLSHCREIVHR